MMENQSVSDETKRPIRQGKRKLMPLKTYTAAADGISQIECNPTEKLSPVCPYLERTSSKPKLCSSSTSKENITPIDSALKKNGTALQKASPEIEYDEELEFAVNSNQKDRKQALNPSLSTRSIVCTYMHRKDVDLVADAVKKLGGYYLEPQVTRATSHVVCGDEKRTINLLRGIAFGCWIIHYDWVTRSVDAGQWINEEHFELKKFPGIHKSRVDREMLRHKNDIFNCEVIYVAQKTSPPRSDLVELLRLCGAITVNSAAKANIIITPFKLRPLLPGTIQVNEKWVLDSIQEYMVQPKLHYSFDTT